MAASSPAPSPREGGPRAPRAPGPSPPPRPRSGSEAEDAELSLSLARTKTRSYGSTASVRAPLGAGVIERHVEHRVRAGDTLQGIAPPLHTLSPSLSCFPNSIYYSSHFPFFPDSFW
uniref:Uncharacterized protein n=1 Tax=Canis lupus dingo TaxID=286419 RepID=A0A8C0KYE0_CANLU